MNKYLKKLGVSKKALLYKGNDIRREDTYDLTISLNAFLYCQLKEYLKQADNIVDLSFHKIFHNGVEITFRDCIVIMIHHLEYLWTTEYDDQKYYDLQAEVYEILSKTVGILWW